MLYAFMRLVCFLGMAANVFLCAFLFGSVSRSMQAVGRFLHLAPPRIYGKRDANVQVFTFNHPSHYDKFVLFDVFGDYAAIARDMAHVSRAFNYVLNRLNCVLVKQTTERQNTTQKVMKHLSQSSKPFMIATSSGIVRDVDIPQQLPTIAFRLGRCIQPIVIIYTGDIDYNNMPDKLPKCLPFILHPPKMIQPHVFFLPTVDPASFASLEDCAAHVRKQMMYVLRYTTLSNKN